MGRVKGKIAVVTGGAVGIGRSGCIITPLVEYMAKEYPGGRGEFIKMMTAQHPIGHVGEPDDIGYGIVYLASDESKFMTGSELVIDGGYTAR